MNRNLYRALGVAFLALGSASAALAQWSGWPQYCLDPTVTSPSTPYSTSYGANAVFNELFVAQVGVSGTVTFQKGCFDPEITLDMAGRMSFDVGTLGSIQTSQDNMLALNMGGAAPGATGAGGNWSYARVYQIEEGSGTTESETFGGNGLSSFFVGASDRYMIATDAILGNTVNLRVDLVGDAARVRWNITNNTGQPNKSVGLYFGQWVFPIGWFDNTPRPINFVHVPGSVPLQVDRQYYLVPNEDPGITPRQYPLPPYVDFLHTQARAWEGLRVINTPDADPNGPLGDQTQVDQFSIGYQPFLLGARGASDGAFPDAVNGDLPQDPADTAYIQKWEPTYLVQGADATFGQRTREIVAYYKTTWGDSNFAKPYAIVVDTPKVVGVQDANPFQFVRSPGTIRVYLDNIRGFTTAEQMITIPNAEVTLTLPQGMHDANDQTRRVMVRNISDLGPKQIKFVDFQVAVDPTTFGSLEYNVRVVPSVGPTKTVVGKIVVASQPYLQIAANANLVTAPWNFANSSWAAVLGNAPNPLQPDIDFQAFTWDAATQQYVLQTSPQRGVGSWLISTQNVGFKPLGGNPTTPQDLATGAPLVELYYGWNLIANPYNYPIQLGQIIGVPGSDDRNTYTYADLVSSFAISGSLAYWDRGTQSYAFIGDRMDVMQPNHGYWVNVLDPQGVKIQFPPVYLPFVPPGTGGIFSRVPRESLWESNLIVGNGSRTDRVNTFGYASPGVRDLRSVRKYEPPISPTKDSISAWFSAPKAKTAEQRLSRMLISGGDHRNFTFNVYTEKAGNVNVRWPEVNAIPANYDVLIKDTVTGKVVDMRLQPNMFVNIPARTVREFRIAVRAKQLSLLGTVSVERTGTGSNDPVAVNYTLNGSANSTVTILRNGQPVKTIAKDQEQSEGSQRVLWDLKNEAGTRMPSGTYQANVTVTDGVKTENQTISFYLK